jgi:hypothetical protein
VEIIVNNIDDLIVYLWLLPVTLSIILPLGIGLVRVIILTVVSVLNGLLGLFGSLGRKELSRARQSGT